ncbi:MAG: CoA transferase [Proteobacteria bacterium]|nr:CoA transferase [Pseudomonadota bacterium]
MLMAPYRVLDLTHTDGMLCAQILGDLGAEVIQVEPPGGAPGRHIGPFYQGQEDIEHSISWWSYSRGKKSLVLDVEDEADRSTLLQLVATADFLIDAEAPGVMAQRGLAYEDLAEINPALIHISMTPYGMEGPKADWVATDLTLLAAGGPLSLTGDADRPPVRVSLPQAWLHAAAEAATGCQGRHSRL